MGPALIYYSFDGSSWTNKTIVDLTGIADVIIMDDVAMAMDAMGRRSYWWRGI